MQLVNKRKPPQNETAFSYQKRRFYNLVKVAVYFNGLLRSNTIL